MGEVDDVDSENCKPSSPFFFFFFIFCPNLITKDQIIKFKSPKLTFYYIFFL